jgi:hypothetical protein
MLSDDSKEKIVQTKGQIKEFPTIPSLILVILDYIEKRLPEFAKTFSHIKPESGLTFQLINLLEAENDDENIFRFYPEPPENPERGDSRAPDIGLMPKKKNRIIKIGGKSFPYNKSFFSIEAKILPIPVSGYRGEKEYVIGHEEKGKHKTCGGIERFKTEHHGKNLNYAGLIGYVQKESFDYWYEQINIWIDELITINTSWQKDDKLKLEKGYPQKETISKYKSKNLRIKSKPITLFHLWVKMN